MGQSGISAEFCQRFLLPRLRMSTRVPRASFARKRAQVRELRAAYCVSLCSSADRLKSLFVRGRHTLPCRFGASTALEGSCALFPTPNLKCNGGKVWKAECELAGRVRMNGRCAHECPCDAPVCIPAVSCEVAMHCYAVGMKQTHPPPPPPPRKNPAENPTQKPENPKPTKGRHPRAERRSGGAVAPIAQARNPLSSQDPKGFVLCAFSVAFIARI